MRVEQLIKMINEIKEKGNDILWWKGCFIRHVVGRYYRSKPNKGIYVMNEDWDNLIILDACRYDTFIEVTGLKCDYRISRGSQTAEFLQENFAGRTFNDTIYITANPYVNLICKGSFYKIIPVWKFGWNEKIGTVPPKEVVKYALKTEKDFHDKRLIIHFIQPHYPYIRDLELCFSILQKTREKNLNINPISLIRSGNPFNLFIEIEKGNLDIETVYAAYKRNLKAVLPYAFKLANKLKGKTVITSDHGEAFGEFALPFPIRVFEHPPYVHIPVLVKVPWLVFDSKERKEIKANDEKHKIKFHIRKLKEKGKI